MPARTTLPEADRVHRHRQVLGLQHLDLQRHRQPILRTAGAQPHQAFAAFEHGAAGQCLQAVEIGQAGGIGFLAPVPPQRLDALAQCAGSASIDCGLMPVPMALATKASSAGIAAQALRRTRSRLLARSSDWVKHGRHRARDCRPSRPRRAVRHRHAVVGRVRRQGTRNSLTRCFPGHQKPLPW
jgi:hypothetical protein